jgi:plasmid stabilization system protein ParE
MTVRYRARALSDLEEISRYLTPRSPNRREKRASCHPFRDRAGRDATAERHSNLGAGIRVKILGRYRYKIFYRVDADAVEIIHVRHSARRPWIGG